MAVHGGDPERLIIVLGVAVRDGIGFMGQGCGICPGCYQIGAAAKGFGIGFALSGARLGCGFGADERPLGFGNLAFNLCVVAMIGSQRFVAGIAQLPLEHALADCRFKALGNPAAVPERPCG